MEDVFSKVRFYRGRPSTYAGLIGVDLYDDGMEEPDAELAAMWKISGPELDQESFCPLSVYGIEWRGQQYTYVGNWEIMKDVRRMLGCWMIHGMTPIPG